MARVNFREATDLLGHIDGEFVGCQIGLPDKESSYTIRFYPFWQHPQLPEDRTKLAGWECGGDAAQPVTIYPLRIHGALLSSCNSAIDWDITNEHPLLWRYEREAQISINQPFSLEQLEEVLADTRSRLSAYAQVADIEPYLLRQNVFRWGKKGSFVLGSFPRPLFSALCNALRERKIVMGAPLIPEPVELPFLCLVDGDHIIADDFELDVPVFEHRPEWIRIK